MPWRAANCASTKPSGCSTACAPARRRQGNRCLRRRRTRGNRKRKMEHLCQLELIAVDRHADDLRRAAEARLRREATAPQAGRGRLLTFFGVLSFMVWTKVA